MSFNTRLPSPAAEQQAQHSQNDLPAASAPAASSVLGQAAVEPSRDAVSLQSLLKSNFESKPVENDPSDSDAAGVERPSPAMPRWTSRVVKSALGLALLLVVGILPAQRFFQVASVEAVINARLITIRSPIDGVVSASQGSLRAGDEVAASAVIVVVENPRVDSSQLDATVDRLGDAAGERRAKSATLEKLRELRAELQTQLDSYRESRLLDADARMREADAHIRAALAEQERSAAALRRIEKLGKSGGGSRAALETARRDAAVADATVEATRAVRSARRIEFDALVGGTYFGDDYNDQPRSAQRLDEIDVQITQLQSDISRLESREQSAGEAILRERAALQRAGKAELHAPATGRIWQVLTAPGEQVSAGQELYSLLDCSQAVVTSVVSEATYNTLSVGLPATFTFREGGAALDGQIVQLSGAAEASSNYAIAPSTLTGDSYRVSITVNDVEGETGCRIGRTGRVVFGASTELAGADLGLRK